MAQAALDEREVALVKAMLARGFPNKTIQFYFNTPQRAVNSGRISEIKGGARWEEVEAASQYELDEFIDHHPMRDQFAPEDEPQPPSQSSGGSVFTVTDADEIDLIPDPPTGTEDFEAALIELHDELRVKSEAALALGHNILGDTSQPIERFNEVLQRDRQQISIVQLWSRGNALRATLRAHDAVADQNDMHPAKLDGVCAERLRDLVEAFNILVANDPKGAELDRLRLGPQEREQALQSLQQIRPVIDDATGVTTEEAFFALEEQIGESEVASEGPEGDNDIALAQATSQNFVLTAILGTYRRVRRLVGDGMSALWKGFNSGVGQTLGLAAGGQLLIFLAKHAPAIQAYVDAVMANPVVRQILDFVMSLI